MPTAYTWSDCARLTSPWSSIVRKIDQMFPAALSTPSTARTRSIVGSASEPTDCSPETTTSVLP